MEQEEHKDKKEYKVGIAEGRSARFLDHRSLDFKTASELALSLTRANNSRDICVYRRNGDGYEPHFSPLPGKKQRQARNEAHLDLREFHARYRGLDMKRRAARAAPRKLYEIWQHDTAFYEAMEQQDQRRALLHFTQIHDILARERGRYNGTRPWLAALLADVDRMTGDLGLLDAYTQK